MWLPIGLPTLAKNLSGLRRTTRLVLHPDELSWHSKFRTCIRLYCEVTWHTHLIECSSHTDKQRQKFHVFYMCKNWDQNHWCIVGGLYLQFLVLVCNDHLSLCVKVLEKKYYYFLNTGFIIIVSLTHLIYLLG